MIWQPARLSIDGRRPKRGNGQLATCEQCLHAAFMIVRLVNQHSLYLQCRNCGHVDPLALSGTTPIDTFAPAVAEVEDTADGSSEGQGGEG
jgi:hypothetical protein